MRYRRPVYVGMGIFLLGMLLNVWFALNANVNYQILSITVAVIGLTIWVLYGRESQATHFESKKQVG